MSIVFNRQGYYLNGLLFTKLSSKNQKCDFQFYKYKHFSTLPSVPGLPLLKYCILSQKNSSQFLSHRGLIKHQCANTLGSQECQEQ